MSQSPLRAEGSKQYADAWRAINILIRSDGTWSGRERGLCYRNRGDGTFDDISFTSGLDLDADGRAFVPLDLDADGDLDLIVKNRNGVQLRAFRNDLRPGGTRHLTIRLEGRRSNRDGVGARVEALTNRRTLVREIVSGSGYLSQRSRVARFALGAGETVRQLRVRWPAGPVQEVEEPPQQGRVTLVEGESFFREVPRPGLASGTSEAAGAVPSRSRAGTWLAVPLPAPDFSLRVMNGAGGTARLSARRGRQVLVNFWATWCPPCRRELASFQSRWAGFQQAGLEILAVSVDDPANSDEVAEFAGKLGLDFPVLLADREAAESYSILNDRLFDRRRPLAIPTSFLLDPEGQIVKVYRGEADVGQILGDAGAGAGDPLPFGGSWALSRPRRDFEDLAAAFAERGLSLPARRMFDAALALGDRSPRLLNNLAGILITDGEGSRGEELLREALAAEPSMTDAKVNLAALLVDRGSSAEAEALLEEALSEQPRDSQALSVLGSVRFAQGRIEQAGALFRRAVAGEPADGRLRENLGAALASMGEFELALAEYEQARALGLSSASLHTNLAVLYMQTGRTDAALESFLSAVDLDPNSPGPHLNLARYRLQAGEFGEAMRAIDRAKHLAPADPGPLLLEAEALLMMGRVPEARRAAEQVLRLDPASAEAARFLESLR